MLPQFRSQLLQLPLIATICTSARDRYRREKETSLFPIRLFLTIFEQTILLVHKTVVRPLPRPDHPLLNTLDNFLCSHVPSIQRLCPIVDQTYDEMLERTSYVAAHVRREKKFHFMDKYFQFVTNTLTVIEMHSKSIQKELNDYIDTSRNLWKNLNMEDGRSLDEVESFSEKLLVLGRRMTGNYRQLVYLMRYQLKRCRYILLSFVRIHHHCRSSVDRMARKFAMCRTNETLNDRARSGLVTSKERVHYYLDMMMVRAAKHPWMNWIMAQSDQLSQPQPLKPLKCIRPIFFVSSNNTSDCSGSEDNLRDQHPKMFESTPYRRTHQRPDVIQSTTQSEEIVSNISSSSSSASEQSFDVKDILRQVGTQSHQILESSSSIDQDDENEIIERAFDQSDVNNQPPVSVFDLSPMLASGCAV